MSYLFEVTYVSAELPLEILGLQLLRECTSYQIKEFVKRKLVVIEILLMAEVDFTGWQSGGHSQCTTVEFVPSTNYCEILCTCDSDDKMLSSKLSSCLFTLTEMSSATNGAGCRTFPILMLSCCGFSGSSWTHDRTAAYRDIFSRRDSPSPIFTRRSYICTTCVLSVEDKTFMSHFSISSVALFFRVSISSFGRPHLRHPRPHLIPSKQDYDG